MNIRARSELLKGTSIVAIFTLLSRILGFIRDVLVARLFGAGSAADAFFVAFRIPNLLRSFVAEGALTSAFVPVFSSEAAHSKESAQKALSSMLSALLFCTTILSLLGILFAERIVLLFAPGFTQDPEKLSLCVLLTQCMMPYIMCVSLIALLNGTLNAYKVYGASAIAQVIMNICLILGALVAGFYVAERAALILALSVIVGGVVQVIAQIPALSKVGLVALPSTHLLSPTTRSVAKLMVPALLGATIYQFTIFLNTVLASLLEDGSVSWLYYADRITQLPIGIFTISLASVLLPNLSRLHSNENQQDFHQNLRSALNVSGFIILPICSLLMVLAEPLVSVLFERGAFTANARIQTALALQAYCLGLWAVSAHSMLSRAFIAKKDTTTSALVGLVSLVSNFLFSLLLIGPLSHTDGTMGHAVSRIQLNLGLQHVQFALGHTGLALSASLASCIACLLLAALLGRKLPGFAWGQVISANLKSLIAALVCGAVAFWVSQQFTNHLYLLCLSAFAGLSSYTAISFLLKSDELHETLRIFSRIVSRGRKQSTR
jgi:putative peptidoglycan lipid II flippase